MNDLIDRYAAIDAVEKHACNTQRILDAINALPSAQSDVPETNVGKWIKMSDADGLYYCCSKCGEELYRKWSFDRQFDLFPKKESIDKTKYCPNCGARMEDKDE